MPKQIIVLLKSFLISLGIGYAAFYLFRQYILSFVPLGKHVDGTQIRMREEIAFGVLFFFLSFAYSHISLTKDDDLRDKLTTIYVCSYIAIWIILMFANFVFGLSIESIN